MVGALQNIEEFGVPNALTGPIVRGDEKVIGRHIEALRQLRPGILKAYKVLGQEAVDIAVRHGSIPVDTANRIASMLEEEEEDSE